MSDLYADHTALTDLLLVGEPERRQGFLLMFAITATVLDTLRETVQIQLCATIAVFLDTLH